MTDLISQLDEQKRKVAFDTYDITVQQLITMFREGAIDVAPVYQRQYRWDTGRQSRLIESIFLGIPVPSLFMAANTDGTWELVDGVQRLLTLIHFAADDDVREKASLHEPLRLGSLEKLSELNNLKYSELPRSVQLQFMLRPIKVITLNDKSDMVVRFDLFERLNTGGVALTYQEIRSCIYRGEFDFFLERLSEYDPFRTVVRLPASAEKDGTRQEYVLRFFAFFQQYQDFKHSVLDFLNEYMGSASKAFDYASNEKLFRRTFDALAKALPKGLSRRTNRTTPVNLYEAVAVGAALALEQNGRIRTAGIDRWLNSEDLRSLTTGATNSPRMVTGRIEFCRNKFGWTREK
ncbi:MAG TPA: DUF262 domain-containing protein [Thermoanaerobaculia bacterium]|nr:DUF262 domain-containing protein [Thermoanaerobaculia bacterium]